MTSDPLAFFTLDRGTASTAVTLIAPLAGRFRLLAAAAQPAGLPVEPLMDQLVRDVQAGDPTVLPSPDGWPDWTRLETATHREPRAVVAAGNERRLAALEVAVAGAGWRIVGRISPERTDALEATRLCLSQQVDLTIIGAGEPAQPEERRAIADLAALVAAVSTRRPPALVLLAGAAADEAGVFEADDVILGPPIAATPWAAPSPLRTLCARLAARTSAVDPAGGPGLPDGRASFRTSIRSLARLLERRVEGVDIGFSAGQRVLATPTGVRGQLTLAEAALVPDAALTDDALADAISGWSTLRGDAYHLRDLVRDLGLRPWAGSTGEGAHLRLGAARAALERLDASWRLGAEADGRAPSYHSDLLVASGGAFAVAPPPAVALALVDTLRRSGAMTMVFDHARVLAPLGSLDAEDDRHRVLADLLDDALLPLGSAIIASGLRSGRRAGTLRITSGGAISEVPVVPGDIEVVDLPPGLTATAELDLRDGAWLGMRARHISVDVGGGLGGLLVDTRDIPLRLPERSERRRDLLEAWQSPLWGDDG